jgi:alpha/beta superfamily hydrolase
LSERTQIRGAAGAIEIASDLPEGVPVAVAVIAHPHPLFGGTMDNKVVTTVERALRERGAATYRFNFRGVGGSQGQHDNGNGETDDTIAVIEHARAAHQGLPLWLAGFSFGGAVAALASNRVDFDQLVLVAPGFRRVSAGGMETPIVAADPVFGPPGRHTFENTVVVHGDIDDTVPLSDSIAWAAAREVNVIVIAGGEHFFHRKLHPLRDAVSRWVRP